MSQHYSQPNFRPWTRDCLWRRSGTLHFNTFVVQVCTLPEKSADRQMGIVSRTANDQSFGRRRPPNETQFPKAVCWSQIIRISTDNHNLVVSLFASTHISEEVQKQIVSVLQITAAVRQTVVIWRSTVTVIRQMGIISRTPWSIIRQTASATWKSLGTAKEIQKQM